MCNKYSTSTYYYYSNIVLIVVVDGYHVVLYVRGESSIHHWYTTSTVVFHAILYPLVPCGVVYAHIHTLWSRYSKRWNDQNNCT